MKRLVKYLFTGFVCSSLLMGCEGQAIENDYTPSLNDRVEQQEKPNIQQGIENVFEEPEIEPQVEEQKEYYTLPNIYYICEVNDYGQVLPRAQKDQVDIKTIDVEGVFEGYKTEISSLNATMDYYLGKYLDPHTKLTMIINEDVFSGFTTAKEALDYANKTYLGLGYSVYKDLAEINYFGGYFTFSFYISVKRDNNDYLSIVYRFNEDSLSASTHHLGILTDDSAYETYEMSEVVSMLNSYIEEGQQQNQTPNEEQTPNSNESNNQQGIGEQFYINGYLAYYSETPLGESVLNVFIDNDSLQVADIDAYFNLVVGHAIGCGFIVMQFGDGSNCVIDHSTLEYYSNQDLNYYRN